MMNNEYYVSQEPLIFGHSKIDFISVFISQLVTAVYFS